MYWNHRADRFRGEGGGGVLESSKCFFGGGARIIGMFRGGGVTHFLPSHSRLTIDHASLSRRGTFANPIGDTSVKVRMTGSERRGDNHCQHSRSL